MNREIKFRAWHKEYKRFLWTNFEKYVSESHEDKPIIERKGTFWLTPTWTEAKVDIIWLQFTGLKDKNGKEIYHKDQFKVNYKVYTVEWNDEYGAWEVTWVDIFKDNKENIELPRRTMLRHFLDDNPSAVVIGNIYENPELLSPQYKQT